VPIIGELKISADDAGGVHIEGSIGNKIFAYGLLEVAKDMIRAHNDKPAQMVQPASPSILSRVVQP